MPNTLKPKLLDLGFSTELSGISPYKKRLVPKSTVNLNFLSIQRNQKPKL